MDKIKIGVFTGSLRKESFCRKTAQALCGMMPGAFEMKPVEIGDLPMFNQDYDDEGRTPAEWTRFREEVKALDGFLFVTPEYNRSMPPVLKNALDIASRPYGQNLWAEKPGGIIGVTPGKLGAFGAGQQLRQTMAFLNIFLMQQPEAYISNAASLFNEQGEMIDKGTLTFLLFYADSFTRWIGTFTDKKSNRKGHKEE
jgi:chromate reductase